MTELLKRKILTRGEVLEWIRTYTCIGDIEIVKQGCNDRLRELKIHEEIKVRGKRVTVDMDGTKVKGTLMAYIRSMKSYKVMTDYGKLIMVLPEQVTFIETKEVSNDLQLNE